MFDNRKAPADIAGVASTPKTQAEIFADVAKNLVLSPMDLGIRDGDPVDLAIKNAFDRSGVLMIGELHGVAENASVVYTLAKRYGVTCLGFEGDLGWRSAIIPLFAKGGEVEVSLLPSGQDGRCIAEYCAVVRQLCEEGQLRKLICFDHGYQNNLNDRDRLMADKIIEELPSAGNRTILIAGNNHTDVKPFRAVGNQVVESAASYLKKSFHDMGFIDLLYESGFRFGTESKGIGFEYVCGVHKARSDCKGEPVYIDDDGRIKIELKNVRPGTPSP